MYRNMKLLILVKQVFARDFQPVTIYLFSLIEITKTKKTKLYCAFIDFKQAFDKVWRNGLWTKLANTDIMANVYNL